MRPRDSESAGDTAVVAGIRTSCLGRSELTDLIAQPTEQRSPRLMFDVNGQGVALFHRDAAYREAVEAADVVHADGQVVVFASRLLCKSAIRERSATTDLIHDVAARAERDGLSFFLLGGEESVNADAAARLKALYPNLRIAGRRNGYFRQEDEDAVLAEINASGADIVWVGLGKPVEQIFAHRVRSRLTCRWIITCGGCFNFLAGSYSRAPRLMQDAGLEWLYRLATNPRKLLWRYLTTNPVALFWILRRSQ